MVNDIFCCLQAQTHLPFAKIFSWYAGSASIDTLLKEGEVDIHSQYFIRFFLLKENFWLIVTSLQKLELPTGSALGAANFLSVIDRRPTLVAEEQ